MPARDGRNVSSAVRGGARSTATRARGRWAREARPSRSRRSWPPASPAALALGATTAATTRAKTYEIVLDNAFGVAEGGDFKIAGVRAGTTEDVHLEGQAHPRRGRRRRRSPSPAWPTCARDAHCEVRPQSFIGEYFVDCQPGTSPRPDARRRARARSSQTSSTIRLDLVNNILRRPYRDRLRLIVGELGAGLAGRPEDLNAAHPPRPPGLRETSRDAAHPRPPDADDQAR